jgi:hypothetical protein
MANNKKMTKREMYESLLAKYGFTTEEKDFINHELELLAKKNVNKSGEKKLTAKQKENETYKAEILEIISTEAHTVSEILKLGNFPEDMTNQRISALLKQMLTDNKVARTEKDRKAYFKAVED